MKKINFALFSLLLFFCTSIFLYTPINASTNASVIPDTVATNIEGNSTVEYDNGSHSYVYSIGGYDGFPSLYNFTNDVYYAAINNKNGTIGSWTNSTNPFPVNMAWSSAIIRKVSKVSYLYVFGGEGYSSSSYHVYNMVYYTSINSDGSINAWQTNPNPIPGSGLILSNVQGLTVKKTQYLYLFGGDGCSGCSSITSSVLYTTINSDGTLAPFVSTSSLPVGLFQPTVVSYTNNKNITFFYVVGGQIFHPVSPIGDISNIYYTNVNSDGTLQPWITSHVNLPTDMCGNSDVVLDHTLHSLGGWSYSTGAGIPNDYSIDINQNGTLTKWSSDVNNLPNSTSAASLLEYTSTDPDYLFVLGGFNNSLPYNESATGDIYRASINGGKIKTWNQISQMLPVGP
jgi:hypothetical protein